MQIKKIASAVAIAAASLAATSAHAAFVIGGTSFAGGFNAGAFTNLPNSIVSGLTSFSIDPSAFAVGSSGNLAPVAGAAVASSFAFPVGTAMFSDAGFTFTLLSYGPAAPVAFTCGAGANAQCTDGIGFTGLGLVTGNGFDPTGFTMSWSANGTCNAAGNVCGTGVTGSWSASISATGSAPPSVVPEPTSLALVGLALAGLGFTARRRAAK